MCSRQEPCCRITLHPHKLLLLLVVETGTRFLDLNDVVTSLFDVTCIWFVVCTYDIQLQYTLRSTHTLLYVSISLHWRRG